MLVKGYGVLLPSLVVSDEVDGDVLPVVVVAMVHSEWVTASLVSVPEVPGHLQEVSTSHHLSDYTWDISYTFFVINNIIQLVIRQSNFIDHDAWKKLHQDPLWKAYSQQP